MTINKTTGDAIKFSDIAAEFGYPSNIAGNLNGLGKYRVSETYGALVNIPLDTNAGATLNKDIPQAGAIRFSDFYKARLNMVVDLYSGATTTRQNIKDKYNNNDVNVVGGFISKPSSTSGKKVIGHINKKIGSVKEINGQSKVAVRSGIWDTDTDFTINLGPDAEVFGAGGDGGDGGWHCIGDEFIPPNNPRVGNNAPYNATSALGVEQTPATVINNGYIQTGYGGGGGGGTAACDPGKSGNDPTAGGGGGGGGAGFPVGLGGDKHVRGSYDKISEDGDDATNKVRGLGGDGEEDGCATAGDGGHGGDPSNVATDGSIGSSTDWYGAECQRYGGDKGIDGNAIRITTGAASGVSCVFTSSNSQSPYSTGSVWSHSNSAPNNNAGNITSGPDVFGLGGTQQSSQSINCDIGTTINGIVVTDPISSVTWSEHNIVETAWVKSSLGGGNASTPNWSQFMVDYAYYPSNTDPLVTTSPHAGTWYSFLSAGTYSIDFQVDNTAMVYWNGSLIGSNGSSPHNTTTTLSLPVANNNSHNFLTILVSNIDNGGGWATNPAGIAFELKNPSGTVIQRSSDAFPTLAQQYAAWGWGTFLQNYNVFPLDTSSGIPRNAYYNQWLSTDYSIVVSNAGNVTVEAAVDGQATFKWNGTTIGSTTNKSGSDSFTVSNVPAGTHILNVAQRNDRNNINDYWYLNPGGVGFVVKDSTNNTIKTSRNTGSQPASPRARIQLANNNRTIQCEDTPIGGDNDYDDLVINCTAGEFSILSATDPATFLWTAPNTAGGGVTIINNGTIHGTTVYNSTVS